MYSGLQWQNAVAYKEEQEAEVCSILTTLQLNIDILISFLDLLSVSKLGPWYFFYRHIQKI